jgi:ribA/ribD-fused uncharacterized protein
MKYPTPDYARVTEVGIYGFFGDYDFLSNFYPSTVLFESIVYPSVENAYQAAKTLDLNARIPFNSMTPGGAKKLGQQLNLRTDWESIKYSIMLELVFQKFLKHPELQAKLVATGGRYLEETNHWGDNTWGVDHRGDIGKNWLGMILMDVRKCMKSIDYVKKEIRQLLNAMAR